MGTDTFFVRASVDASGEFADCSYFLDRAATQPVPSSQLRIPQVAGACLIGETADSPLKLLGTVYKTLGHPSSLNNHNYAPANDEGQVSVVMPTAEVVTKGVVLLFADPLRVECLYPSADPEITNNDP